MEIRKVPLSQIIPYENNPRRNDEAVDAVTESIRQCGYCAPIVVDENMVVLAGHTRLKALKRLAYSEAEVVIREGLTEEQKKKYRLLDNKTGELAEWDFEKLERELENMDFGGFDFGFDINAGGDLGLDDVQDDEPDLTPPATPVTVLGDIYQLGRHRLMCGDSTKINDVMRLMQGEKARMVFTDPPWNVNYGDTGADNSRFKPRTILNDFMGTEEFRDFMRDAFRCMNEVSEDGAMTYVVMSAQEWGNMMLMLASNGYHWSSTIIWNKDQLVLSRKDYHTKYEPIWYGWKEGKARLHPLKDRKQADVWDFDRPKISIEHPTMKPVPLVAQAIQNSSDIGDIVLDLFGGSGTTLIAAEQLDRRCLMMELDPKYCDVIVRRWEEFTGEKAIRLTE